MWRHRSLELGAVACHEQRRGPSRPLFSIFLERAAPLTLDGAPALVITGVETGELFPLRSISGRLGAQCT